MKRICAAILLLFFGCSNRDIEHVEPGYVGMKPSQAITSLQIQYSTGILQDPQIWQDENGIHKDDNITWKEAARLIADHCCGLSEAKR